MSSGVGANAEPIWLGIEALLRDLEKGEASAIDITDVFLDRIERLDGRLQAYSVLWPERARETARRLDAERAAGEPLRPLHGVPVALKDLCDVRSLSWHELADTLDPSSS